MYSQSILDEIRDKVSIVALIGERVALKKAGRNFRGNCPFHSEKTPSFMVSDEKRIYHCFGCGEGGNVFNFFMKFDGLSFRESVEMLSARAGIALPKQSNVAEDDEADKRKKSAFRINRLTADYYSKNLSDNKKGAAARNYLKSRDIFLEKNTQHFLGYAEDSWDGLVKHLNQARVPLDLAAEVGVIKKRDGGGYYDFFRHRVIFPVMLPSFGDEPKIAAFSGRTFGEPKTSEGREAPAKYLNSPDSVIYHKSYTTYGLNAAAEAIRKNDFVIIVEGNLDVIRLHQEGLKNTVAPLGTALTIGHLKLLCRYSKNFVLVFDGDDAGRKAAARSLPLFLESDIIPRVVVLPDGEDPDSFVRKNGAKVFEESVQKARTLFDWIIDDTVSKFGYDAGSKTKVVEELRPLFSMLKNPVEAAVYKRKLGSLLTLDESVISDLIKSGKAHDKREKNGVAKVNSLEKTLLELILAYPETISTISSSIGPEQFEDESLRTIVGFVFSEYKKTGRLDVAAIADTIADDGLKNEIMELSLAEKKYDEPVEAANDCILNIKKTAAKRRLHELTTAVQKNKDENKMIEYMNEIHRITKEIHNIEGLK
ncbi:MAG: DNA primase [Deltaproteobacteria bacterium]|nr:DNA primase [Deltaproteobacteria bacterium]